MPKYHTSRSFTQAQTVAAAFLILSIIFPCALTTPAQQGGAAPTQRPRRVNAPVTQPAPPSVAAPGADEGAARRRAGAEEVDEDDVVRVDTQLVTVPAVVTDATGRPVVNLRANDFVLLEDGRPQRLANFATTEAPFEVALLLDTSGSTRSEVGLIRRAALAFVEALRPGDRVAVLSFSTTREGPERLTGVDIKTALTSDREQLREAILSVSASNGTPFYDGLERAASEVFREAPRDEVRGRRALVALTDGVDSSSESDYEEARARLRRAGLVTYFVQVNTEEFVENRLLQDCADDGALGLSRAQLQRYRRLFAGRAEADDYSSFCRLGAFERMHISRTLYQLARQEMNQLARETGGKTFPVADLSEARAAFRQVAAEIGTQYSLGYYPSNKTRDGRFRAIKVEVKGVRDARVRARDGYVAPRG